MHWIRCALFVQMHTRHAYWGLLHSGVFPGLFDPQFKLYPKWLNPQAILLGVPNLIIHLGVDLLRAEQI